MFVWQRFGFIVPMIGIAVVDVIGDLAAAAEPVYFRDGVHLVAHGHQVLADQIWSQLKALLLVP